MPDGGGAITRGGFAAVAGAGMGIVRTAVGGLAGEGLPTTIAAPTPVSTTPAAKTATSAPALVRTGGGWRRRVRRSVRSRAARRRPRSRWDGLHRRGRREAWRRLRWVRPEWNHRRRKSFDLRLPAVATEGNSNLGQVSASVAIASHRDPPAGRLRSPPAQAKRAPIVG